MSLFFLSIVLWIVCILYTKELWETLSPKNGKFGPTQAVRYATSLSHIQLWQIDKTKICHQPNRVRQLILQVENTIRSLVFPLQTRQNVSSRQVHGFLLGYAALFEACPHTSKRRKVWKLTKATHKYNKFYILLCKLMRAYDPSFHFDGIQVNASSQDGRMHVDKRNMGMSYIIALGGFGGNTIHNSGGLQILDRVVDIQYRFVKFYGHLPHRALPTLTRSRFSVVFFSSTSDRLGDTQQRAGVFVDLVSCIHSPSAMPMEISQQFIRPPVHNYSPPLLW